MWCFTRRRRWTRSTPTPGQGVAAAAPAAREDLRRRAGRAHAVHLGYAFRAMPHPRPGAVHADPAGVRTATHEDYFVIDGEMVAGTVLGWNFGDGHLHDEQLIAALQKRCHFEPGEVRVVMLEAQPIHKQTQRYRLVDAATGELERGYVEVADMVRAPAVPTRDCPSTSPRRHAVRQRVDRVSTRSSSAPAPTGSRPPSRSPSAGSRSPCSRRATRSAAAPAPRS